MRIGIDLDDVLVQFLPSLIKFHNKTYGTNLKLDQFGSYQFWEIWGGTKEEAIQKVYNFHKTHYFANIPPVSGSQDAINFLSEKHELYIITSRQNDIAIPTRESVQKHFPNSFSEIHFTNHYSQNGNAKTKKEVCDSLSIDVMIEDSADYAMNCLNNDRKIFLINQSWNTKRSIPQKIYRVNSWQEIIDSM
jgi:uncharacterized HAD superfamily protein